MMQHKEFSVPNIQGEEDASMVENALNQLSGVQTVSVLRTSKRVTVEWTDPATWDEIERVVESLGYPVAAE